MASAEGTDYNQWLSELDKYAASSAQPGGGPAGLQGLNASSSGVPHKGRLNAVEQLEQEMKLLHWHKLANEAALKAALIRTKRLRQKDRRVSHKPMSAEKAAWMQRVVEEEQMKPLEVTDDFIRQYEEQERKESEKLESEVERHIKNLQQLKDNLQKREEQTRRHAVFRKKKKMLEETPIVVGDSQPAGDGTAGPRGALDLEVSEVQAGETVATSLNKLVELEQRIAQLELNDGPPSGRRQTPGSRMSARSARSGGSSMGGTTLVFRKKRTATRLDAPAKTVFSVQMVDKRTAAQQRQQTRRLSAGSRKLQARARARQQRQARERVRNQRQGAIINNWMSERKTKQAARRRRNQQRLVASKARAAAARRQLHNSSAAAGAPARGAPGAGAARRSRRGASDAAERRARGARARRAQQQQHAGRGRRAARGPAAGARQQFRDVRRQFEAAKDNARRDLAATRSGYNSNARGRRRQGAGGGGASSGRWATRRGQGTHRRNGGLDASRASGQSFRFSTRGGGGRAQRQQQQQHQVGSRLGGASRRARTQQVVQRRRRGPTNSKRLHQTEVNPRRQGRARRSGVASKAAARAAARRRAAAAAASQRHATRRKGGRSTGFGTSNRFRGRNARRTNRRQPKQPQFGVAGRSTTGGRRRAGAAPKRGVRGTRGGGSRYRRSQGPQATTLPTIGRY